MKKMVPVDFSRIKKFCEMYGGMTAVALKLGQGNAYFISRSKIGTVSKIVLSRVEDMYHIPQDLFFPSTPAEEFQGWLEAHKPEPKKQEKLCDRTCHGCKFRGTLSGVGGRSYGAACLYIIHTTHARGCPPGKGCKRRKEGPALSVPINLL